MVTFYNFFVKCQQNATVRDVAGKFPDFTLNYLSPQEVKTFFPSSFPNEKLKPVFQTPYFSKPNLILRYFRLN